MTAPSQPPLFTKRPRDLTVEQSYVLGLVAESPRRVSKDRTSAEEDLVRAQEVQALDRRGLVVVREQGGMAVAYITPAGVVTRSVRAH